MGFVLATFWLGLFDVGLATALFILALIDMPLPNKYRPSYALDWRVAQIHDAIHTAIYLRKTVK